MSYYSLETIISEQEVLELLRGLVTYDRSQGDIARELGISPGFVSSVFSGKKPPSPAILELIGVERRTTFFLKQGRQ